MWDKVVGVCFAKGECHWGANAEAWMCDPLQGHVMGDSVETCPGILLIVSQTNIPDPRASCL